MDAVTVGKPEMDDCAKVNFSTELAFAALVDSAKKQGLALNPVLGLMYLPSQEVTEQFQAACRAVLGCLAPQG